MSEKGERIQFTVVTILDCVAIILSAFLANWIRFSVDQKEMWLDNTTIVYILLVYIIVSFFCDTKKEFLRRGLWRELVDVLTEFTLTLLILITVMYVFKISDVYSRLVVGYFYVLAVLLSYIFRIVYKFFIGYKKRNSYYTKCLVIVTMQDLKDEILDRLRYEEMWNYKFKGLILLDAPDELIESQYHGVQIIGNQGTMFDCMVQRVVDEVFIYLPDDTSVDVRRMIEKFEAMGVTVDLNVNVHDVDLQYRDKELRKCGECYVITFRQSVSSLKMRVIKRTMDIAGALVGLLITGIVTIFLAPALKIDSPGPLFFSQTRVGMNGRRFKIYKFRSMYMDAEERKAELMEKNEMSGLMFKMENDPRITKVGKFIRKTSIDELPQFWNVLKGDMSLIGTRPPTEDEFEKYPPEYKRRLSIRPGLTGMWQATGRSDITDFEEVLALDLQYIDNWSLSLDIKILIKTVFGVLGGRGAK